MCIPEQLSPVIFKLYIPCSSNMYLLLKIKYTKRTVVIRN